MGTQPDETNTTAGPDGVQAVLLKNCAASMSVSLAYIFQKSIDKGKLPSDWKTAAVKPIFKDGDKEDIINYRPVSITSIA